MDDEAYRRYVRINLPHARTLIERIGHNLEALGAFAESSNGGALALRAASEALAREAAPYDDDPPREEALAAADPVALPWIAAALDRIGAMLADFGP